MNKLRCRSAIWLCLLCILTIGHGRLHGSSGGGRTDGIGREDPFAGFGIGPSPMDQVVTSSEPLEERPDVVMETVVLRFLDAQSLVGIFQKMLTQYGAATVNKENNSIVICDTPENMKKILTQIQKADRPPQQIAIEVVTLDVKLEDSSEIGVSWDLLTDDILDVAYRQSFNESRLTSTIEDATTIGAATAFNSVGLGGDVSVVIGTVRYVLHMIQQKRETEILASPRTLVVSGSMATIKAVEEIPYEEVTDTAAGGSGALTSTQFKEVGVNLQVTATVVDGNDIVLRVDVEQNVRTGQSASGVPVVDTRQATTSLFLKDGQTAVFAGLRRQEESKEVSKVPFFGDLPILGNLFRKTNTIKNNSELVVLLSARIDQGEGVPQVLAAKWEAFRRNSLLSREDPNEVGVSASASRENEREQDARIEIGPNDAVE